MPRAPPQWAHNRATCAIANHTSTRALPVATRRNTPVPENGAHMPAHQPRGRSRTTEGNHQPDAPIRVALQALPYGPAPDSPQPPLTGLAVGGHAKAPSYHAFAMPVIQKALPVLWEPLLTASAQRQPTRLHAGWRAPPTLSSRKARGRMHVMVSMTAITMMPLPQFARTPHSY